LRTTYFGRVMRLLQFMFGIIFVGIIGTGMPAKPKTIRGAQFITMEWLVDYKLPLHNI
jgi:hypothetical protein